MSVSDKLYQRRDSLEIKIEMRKKKLHIRDHVTYAYISNEFELATDFDKE